jgi:hypothetical protein
MQAMFAVCDLGTKDIAALKTQKSPQQGGP